MLSDRLDSRNLSESGFLDAFLVDNVGFVQIERKTLNLMEKSNFSQKAKPAEKYGSV